MNSDESDDYDFNEKRKRSNCFLDSTPGSSCSTSPIVGTSKKVCSRRRKVATAVIEETDSDSDAEAEHELSHKSKVKKSTQDIQKWLSSSNGGTSREGSQPKMEQADSQMSSGEESIVIPIHVGRCHQRLDSHTDTSLRSDFSSPILGRRGKYSNLRLDSTEESSSNESCDSSPIIVSRRIHTVTLRLDSESEEDSDNMCFNRKASNSVGLVSTEKDAESDSSDDTSEKCPICLVSFKMKQIGIPENCEHCFCLECIQEWSKNMNTCPVDRKEYLSILVKDCFNGSLVRTISVEKPQELNDTPFINLDDVVCEICASNENEDRLLLCDGCDLAFHLYCLTPPLDEIPPGEWYCNVCADVRSQEASLIQTRIVPRTRQSERVRRSVENNRRNRRRSERVEVEDYPSTSTASRSNRITSSTVTRKTKKKRRANRYKTVYELNESGEAVPVKRKVGSIRRKKRSKRTRSAPQRILEKSIKKRLAAHLGMCAPRSAVPQALPDVKIPANSNLNLRRHQAGIPNLDLFGTANRLDYFDQSEDEQDMFREIESRGVHTMLARRNTTSTSDILRRVARRKAVAVSFPTVSSSTDILDSIMDSQARLLSKNSVFSVLDSSGKLQIEDKKKDPLLNNNNPEKPDFNSYTVRETPWHGRNGNYNRPQNRGGYYNRGWHNNYRHQGRYGGNYSYGNTSNSNSNNYIPPQDQYYNDAPQDYTQRTLCEAEMLQENEENKEKNTPQSDQDVDVYGDIESETVSTSRVEDDDFKPESPPVQAANNDEDDDDSESGMIIDTDRATDEMVTSTNCEQVYSPGNPTGSPCQPSYSPTNPTGSPEVPTENPESIAEGFSELQKELASGFDELKRGFEEFQNEMNQSMCNAPVESSQVDSSQADQTCISGLEGDGTLNTTDHLGKIPYDDEVSNDGCPNFSIYSRETKSVVLTLSSAMSQPSEEEASEFELTQPVAASIPQSDSESWDVEPTQPLAQPMESWDVEPTQPLAQPMESWDVDPTQPLAEPIPVDQITDESSSLPATQQVTVEKTGCDPRLQKPQGNWNLGALYSDSEDESVVKKSGTFGLSDIKDMTEDILSEEERSYTPVLDEKTSENKEGLEGLETELISDDDKNDFDESHELKTVNDGDALEINAKESEMEFTRPEEFEDGEISDKRKEALSKDAEPIDSIGNIGGTPPPTARKVDGEDAKRTDKDKETKKKKKEKNKIKDDTIADKENVDKESFKKLSKGSKERNYRDKDKTKSARHKSRSKSPEETEKEKETRKRKEKRKELERYNVRALIADKPRPPPKDQFGRDLPSRSRSRSRSYTPPLPQTSPIRERVSPSPIRAPTPIGRKSRSRSVSRGETPPRSRRSESKRRSKTREKSSKQRARTKSRSVGRKRRDRSKVKKRKRSTSKSTKRKRSKEKNKKNQTSRSRRRSRTPQSRSPVERRNRRDWTPSLSRSPSPTLHRISPSWTPPRRETPRRSQNLTVILNNGAAKKKKDKRSKRRRAEEPSSKRRRRERDRTPPPSKEVFASGDNILVSVSFNNENETRDVSTRDSRKRKDISENHSQKKNKERRNKNRKDLSGIKPVAIIDLERSPFQEIAGSPKDVIVLSDSDNNETENRNLQNPDSSQQVASPEITPNYSMGPKTPPEPSVKFSLVSKPAQVRTISNPLHDPLETIEEDVTEEENNLHKGPNTPPEEPPTSPPSSPDVYDPFEPTKSRSVSPVVRNPDSNDQNQENVDTIDLVKSGETPDAMKSLTPPMPDIQPADSQSSIQEISDSKSPEIGAGTLSQTVISKPVGQTMPFNAVQTSNTATSVSSTNSASRINILSSTMINPTIPQRIVLPNQIKSSPVKIAPTTKAAVKLTPIKPLQLKKTVKSTNGNSLEEINLDFDSPYSPGSSDYDDLFEPPIEPPSAMIKSKKFKRASQKKPAQNMTTFDSLFGSPSYQKKINKRMAVKNLITTPNKTKHVGVKIDEDSLKILEELPNSAVEMQVKDKFLKKLNRQERVVEEVKLVLKPYYNKKKITKEEYKDIMRRAVPKICHNKSGEINPNKIRHLVEAYVKKLKQSKKVTSSSSLPQKVVV